jgi:alpha-amylase
MHKKMQALSLLCRQRGDPAEPRRAIGRAQCNDAYWHGVFGGLYLPHLRRAIWHSLAVAEQELRRKEPLAVEKLDLDGDGVDEIWIHSSVFSALVSPSRGGVIEEYTLFAARKNFADVLTRRREVYHELTEDETKKANVGTGDGAPSIHEMEKGVRLDRLPPVDRDARALFVDRVLSGDLTYGAYASGEYDPIASWAGAPVEAEIRTRAEGAEGGEVVEVICRARQLEKALRFKAAGGLTVSYRWDPAAFPAGALFAPEVSLAHGLELKCAPAADLWSFPIATVSKSERGLDETVQGNSLTPRWPASLGQAQIELLVG